MSFENKTTIEVYQNGGALRYLENEIVHNALDKEKADRKKEKLQKYLAENLSALPKGAKVFEVGSATGETAKYLKDCGFVVTASDVADDFLNAIKSKGVEAVKFNLLEDDFKEKFDAIICWRVFVHFTAQDFALSLKKIHAALKPNGVFIFNMINRETKNVDSEMLDFDNEYKMGKERYYNYYNKDFVDAEIQKLGFKLQSFHTEGGQDKNKWLVYTIKA